jgi:hypothetical protein
MSSSCERENISGSFNNVIIFFNSFDLNYKRTAIRIYIRANDKIIAKSDSINCIVNKLKSRDFSPKN